MYTPPNCKSLDQLTDELQIRLLLQAAPFSGKTYAAMTFPNPCVLDFDQKLGAHAGRKDIIQVPFYDGKFCDSIVKRDALLGPPNKKDALLKWLTVEAPRLHRDQTLVIDGLSAVDAGYHNWFNQNKDQLATSKKGEYNKFVEWDLKGRYFKEILDLIKSVNSHVVMICHEQVERNKDGDLTGGVKPLIAGAMADALAGAFTDCFRVLPKEKPKTPERLDAFRTFFKVDKETEDEWFASGTNDTFWLFQTQADDLVKAGTGTIKNCPKYILADYKSFAKYRNKQQTPT